HLPRHCALRRLSFFFCNPPPTTETYTLSLHDALPISIARRGSPSQSPIWISARPQRRAISPARTESCCTAPPSANTLSAVTLPRSEEHTSELQSRGHLVCRLLLEKKKTAPHCTSRAAR